jgi:hypothetical protein
MRYLAINGGRIFSGPTGASSLSSFVGSTQYGRDLNGGTVDTAAKFAAAIAELRLRKDLTNGFIYVNPVLWDKIDTRLAAISTIDLEDKVSGSDNTTFAELPSMGIDPLVLVSLGVSSSGVTSTTVSPSYWSSRWELYKMFYAAGR